MDRVSKYMLAVLLSCAVTQMYHGIEMTLRL